MTVTRPRTLVLALAGLGAALLIGCSSTSEQVSDEIADKVQDQLKLDEPPAVVCPDDAEAGEGKKFECTVDLDGEELDLEVEFSNDTNFEATPKGNVFTQEEMETFLTQSYAGVAVLDTIECPKGDLLVFSPDTEIDCTVTDDQGNTATVTIGIEGEDYQPTIKDEQPA